MLYRQMPPNIQLNWLKRCYGAKQEKIFGEKGQDYKDGSGLQFVNFDFVTGDQEISFHSGGNLSFLVVILSF